MPDFFNFVISLDPYGAEHQTNVGDSQRSNEQLSPDLRSTSAPYQDHQHGDVAECSDNEDDPLYSDSG